MTTAELIRHLRAAISGAETDGRAEVAKNLQLALDDLIAEAQAEEDAAMRRHLREHTNPGAALDLEKTR